MKLSPMAWGIHMLNLRAHHSLFTFNRDMFVGGTYTSYQYTSIGNCAWVYYAICDRNKLREFILNQGPNNNYWTKTYHYGVNRSVFYRFRYFCWVQFCKFFPVNTIHIQHGNKFIELIARSTLGNERDTWLWFSRKGHRSRDPKLEIDNIWVSKCSKTNEPQSNLFTKKQQTSILLLR